MSQAQPILIVYFAIDHINHETAWRSETGRWTNAGRRLNGCDFASRASDQDTEPLHVEQNVAVVYRIASTFTTHYCMSANRARLSLTTLLPAAPVNAIKGQQDSIEIVVIFQVHLDRQTPVNLQAIDRHTETLSEQTDPSPIRFRHH